MGMQLLMVFFVIDTVPLELGVLHVHTNPFEHGPVE